MGLFDFVKDAGERIFGGDDDDKGQAELDQVLADKKMGESITKLVLGMGMKVENFRVAVRQGKAVVGGEAAHGVLQVG